MRIEYFERVDRLRVFGRSISKEAASTAVAAAALRVKHVRLCHGGEVLK
jgi:hypothetical protein